MHTTAGGATVGDKTYYAWGGSSVIAEYTETAAATTMSWAKSYIYAGDSLLSTITKSGSSEVTEYHHPDGLGTKLITNTATNTAKSQSSLPFGTAISSETTATTNQKFTSYDRSGATGLDYAVNRSYNSGQSRFTQVDPIGMASASIGNPQSLNLFAYTQNNPVDFVDPSGLFAIVIGSGGQCQYFEITNWNGEEHVRTQYGWICSGFGSTESQQPNDIGGEGGGTKQSAPAPPTCTLKLNVTAARGGLFGLISTSSDSDEEDEGDEGDDDSNAGVFNHLYVTLTDSKSGVTNGYRAGPFDIKDQTIIAAEVKEYRKGNFTDYEKNPTTAATRVYDGTCAKLNRSFSTTATLVNDAKIEYGKFSGNSNSFIRTMLRRADLKPSGFQEDLDKTLGTFGFAPGWSVEIDL